MQYSELTALRKENAGLNSVYRECEDAVLHRLDLAFAGFFRRCSRGETPGYPRFKPASRWRQITFPHGFRALKFDTAQRRVRVPGVGNIALRKGRIVPKFGRAFIVTKNDRWYAVFECQRDPTPLVAGGKMVGVDRGVTVLAATSDGELITNPRHACRSSARVEMHSRALEAATTRDMRGFVMNSCDGVRVKARRRLARVREREANARRDHAHKVALNLVRQYDVIALEALNVRNMVRSARGTVS